QGQGAAAALVVLRRALHLPAAAGALLPAQEAHAGGDALLHALDQRLGAGPVLGGEGRGEREEEREGDEVAHGFIVAAPAPGLQPRGLSRVRGGLTIDLNR